MKILDKAVCIAVMFTFCSAMSFAQIRINDPGRVVERQAENRANRKVDQAVDKGFDSVEQGIGNLFKKKEKEKKDAENKGNASQDNKNADASNAEKDKGSETAETPPKTGKPTLKSYSKFDFIPGEKVVAAEDFSQDAVGDFPAKWNTNSSGEVVTIEGTEGKWLMLGPEGVFYPEFVTSLPENFTLEFNLASTSEFSFYTGYFRAVIAEVGNAAKDFTKWKSFDGEKVNGMEIALHPKNAGGTEGLSAYNIFSDTPANSLMKNEKSFPAFHAPDHNVVKVSIWRQKGRLRMYVDDFKVWDLPRAFNPETKYNFIAFSSKDYQADDRYFISNLRVAVGAPDTRSKLITEGKFSTTGILFDVNSANIKPESYGVLKEIAGVLTENAAVKVKIIGHTDSDGEESSNLALSKKRSEAVKQALAKDFGIDGGRLETDGKGEAEPAGLNTTIEGKANNRRVEFVKM
ncbi:OmpA family protein [Dyadobacter arcticus]|uniref:Outer membrane protein OmpA-like peptidoglycan-associated protein n=1 Tax=Dyadobacter arcticus TaxID=1078754 RepID=A0ABX0UNK7_9BACT|nr:OmpA family protein [Dyadobacter arcticus]NIJ53559.1 outer membrane protein OmpA-like peptidoglycan-associated protein [Dyadobacter arcticus]